MQGGFLWLKMRLEAYGREEAAAFKLHFMTRCFRLHLAAVFALFSFGTLLAVYVPPTVPKALKETEDPAAVAAHEKAAEVEGAGKETAAPVIPADWVEQIRQMAEGHAKRVDKPAENFELIFKKNGTLARLMVHIARNAQRTPNDPQQNHEVCKAEFEVKKGKLKLTLEGSVEGPDGYELFGIAQLATVAREAEDLRKLQEAFTKNGLNYALEAHVVVAPDGKSWAWEVSPAEEQQPNVIYAMYYYPITRELHSTAIDVPKVAAGVERAAKQAGMRVKWVKDMRER
jgi:hypothetical protein